MRSTSSTTRKNEEEDDDSLYDEVQIEWINLIFLPFNPIFQFVVLVCVILKVVLGPLQACYGVGSNCKGIMDYHILTKTSRYVYKYPAAIIYFIDTFLHIVHRQVTDKALRRAYLPKSAFLILLDILSMIPFHDLMAEDTCNLAVWPNIVCFIEFFIVYRIVQYFELIRTHTCWKQYIGYTILIAVIVNCAACFLILLTFNGLCANCQSQWVPGTSPILYDWRAFFVQANHSLAEHHFNKYFYGYSYIMAYVTNIALHTTKPLTLMEFVLACILVECSYMLDQLAIFPKLFAEAALTLRRICSYDPHVKRIINDIKRRNQDPTAHVTVENFYNLMWKQRMGITLTPKNIAILPRYLRLDIYEDLTWQIFYHSPTLRTTSLAFKRYLCAIIRCDYKLPGENFFAGPHCHTHLYYLKSGIVQLISADDGLSPLISVMAGTLFGDISFYIPPLHRKIKVKCLTYCEVLVLTRRDFLRTLHRYPEDRKEVYRLAKDKLQHAKQLYNCKLYVKGVDRAEDEGVKWLKRRWWEISNYVDQYRSAGKKVSDLRLLLPEETSYHCAKYIGQLVLSNTAQLKQSSLFIKDSFLWVLAPNSIFNRIWHNFIKAIVVFVLIYYPPNITHENVSSTFIKIKYFVDFIYVSDICVSLLTAIASEENATSNFASVMLVRFKKPAFVMDILACLWIEKITTWIGKPEYFYVCHFNRLIKIYILFPKAGRNWKLGRDHMFPVYLRIFSIYFIFAYISAFVVFTLVRFSQYVSPFYFFGASICARTNQTDLECLMSQSSTKVAINFVLNFIYNEMVAKGPGDIALKMIIAYNAHILYRYCKATYVAGIYLRYKDILKYQKFVSTVNNYYRHHEIHPSLLMRLNRYMDCHWKYHYGMDVMYPNLLKEEPFDVFWKAQGEVAERIISKSEIFIDADPAVIKELAYLAKFLVMPKGASLHVLGDTCKHVKWIVQGHVKVEYHDDLGEIVTNYFGAGHMLSVTPALLAKPSLRTYTCDTDCEIMYVSVPEFLNVLKRHPRENSHFRCSIADLAPRFDEVFNEYIKKYAEYHRRLHERLYQLKTPKMRPRQNVASLRTTRKKLKRTKVETELYVDPESRFIQYWMPFRTFIVFVSIVAASLQGIGGAFFKWYLDMIETICNAISLVDMTMKFFLAYYDERGFLETKKLKTITYYLSHSFLIDLVGALPWGSMISLFLTRDILQGYKRLINTLAKFGHLYILMGYFDFLADRPSAISAIIKIAKWQLLTILLMLAGSHFLINLCVDYTFDSAGNLANLTLVDTCWMPYYLKLEKNPTLDDLHMIFAQSLNLAQSGLLNVNHASFDITKKGQSMVAFTLVVLAIIYWYVVAYSVTILVLVSRSDSVFQHDINQLRTFLKSERVEEDLINQTTAFFSYWRIRTKGINIQTLMTDRVGMVLRQDMSYFFYKSTTSALNTILEGGDQFQRDMACFSHQMYFLPKAEIMREMDLMPALFVVHRGRVVIMQDEEKLAVLPKGSIFGQLTGTSPRPVKVTAIADSYCDVLKISLKDFNDIVTEEVKDRIITNTQSKNDFMATKSKADNPRFSIAFLLRGRKTIQLPWMLGPKVARQGSWYIKWLYIVWLFGPSITAYITEILMILPYEIAIHAMWCLLLFDLIHLVHTVTEYYTLEVAIVGNKCVNRKVGYRLFKDWRFYVNVLSLVIPLMTLVTGSRAYLMARVARLVMFYDFHKHFCTTKSNLGPFMLKSLILLLILHYMACGWIYMACREKFPIKQPTEPDDIPKANATIDYNEWLPAEKRYGGCSRPTFYNYFVVPKYWWGDYIVALTFIIVMHTGTVLGNNMQMTVAQVYYKVFINIIIYLIDIWLMSLAIGYIYTKYRDFYLYDFEVKKLNIYLRHSGLAPSLLRSVDEYTTHLWKRQGGNWMPELAMQAPSCLREDLFGALYLHHILTPPLFKELPQYFTRQLVARAKRIVVFPEKCLVKEGDIYSVMYFIHEGEIEKWWNYNSPERKLAKLLSTNGYFGFLPGLFPYTRFQFTYITRTVVDLICLDLADWQDLLTAYPAVKSQLYEGAMRLKKDGRTSIEANVH